MAFPPSPERRLARLLLLVAVPASSAVRQGPSLHTCPRTLLAPAPRKSKQLRKTGRPSCEAKWKSLLGPIDFNTVWGSIGTFLTSPRKEKHGHLLLHRRLLFRTANRCALTNVTRVIAVGFATSGKKINRISCAAPSWLQFEMWFTCSCRPWESNDQKCSAANPG